MQSTLSFQYGSATMKVTFESPPFLICSFTSSPHIPFATPGAPRSAPLPPQRNVHVGIRKREEEEVGRSKVGGTASFVGECFPTMYVHVQIPLFSLLASIPLDLAAARMGGQFLFPPPNCRTCHESRREISPSSSSPVRLSRPTFPLITSPPLAAAEEEEGSPTHGRQTAFPPLARHGPCVCNFSPRGSPYVPPSLFSPLRCCRHRARGRRRRAVGRPRCQKNNEDEVLLLLLQEMCPPPPYLGGEGEGELKRQPRKKERGASSPLDRRKEERERR